MLLNENNSKSKKKKFICEKCGTITVSIYKELNSGSHLFYVEPDNEDILPISYIIEDALALY